ncbi:MAG: ABC transporter permease subunit [Limisphaerales bacterium]
MTLLPIAERELRVAARLRSTFWVRTAAALVALTIGAGFMILHASGVAGTTAPSLGQTLFGVLTWLALAPALAAGLFFTSDCLSEEKREGTMGFLFLTDLRGHDIVLGKLLATSLRGFYAMLAVFPILAVTVPMGGVTGAALGRTSLALASALLLSLATGLVVSAFSRDSQRAMAGTLLLLILLAAGGPAMDATQAAVGGQGFDPRFSLLSPVYVFTQAGAWGPTMFWWGLLVNGSIALALFALACVALPHTWQDQRPGAGKSGNRWTYGWRYGGVRRAAGLRRKLMEVNPVVWLACRRRWQGVPVWALAILAIGSGAAIFAFDSEPGWWMVWSFLTGVFTLVIYLEVTSHAVRLFVEARRNGLLELLLATPLSAERIVQGQWQAASRTLALPIALYLTATLVGTAIVQDLSWKQMAAANPVAPGAITNSAGGTVGFTNAPSGLTFRATASSSFISPNAGVTFAMATAGVFTVAANLVALFWFGMWMGLTSRTANQATLLTILCVQIIPWFVMTFAVALMVPLVLMSGMLGKGATPGSGAFMTWFPLLTTGLTTLLYVGKDVFFVLWARRRLHSQFRDRIAFAGAPPPRPTRSGLRPFAIPPVIK